MSYGFSCLNTSGYVQIDDNYSNTYVIASGSQLASPSGVTLSILPPAGFTDPYLILIRSDSYNVPMWAYGGTVRAVSNITVDIVLLAFNNNSSAPTDYGFAVYRPDGVIAFAADRKTGSVQARRQLTLAESNAYTTAYTMSIPNYPLAGKKRYFSFNSCAVDRQQQNPQTTGALSGRRLCFYNDVLFNISTVQGYQVLPPSASNINESFPSKRQYLIVDF
jgi:hypothetical protein